MIYQHLTLVLSEVAIRDAASRQLLMVRGMAAARFQFFRTHFRRDDGERID